MILAAKKTGKKKLPLSTAVIAAHFNVNRRTVSEWFRKGCPRTTIQKVAQWRADSLRPERMAPNKRPDGADGTPGDLGLSITQLRLQADTEKIREDIAFRRQRNAERAKEVISRKIVEREVAELLMRLKQRLLMLPSEYETRFPLEVRAQCKADLAEWVRQLLLEMSRWKIGDHVMDDQIVAAAETILAMRSPAQLEPLPAIACAT